MTAEPLYLDEIIAALESVSSEEIQISKNYYSRDIGTRPLEKDYSWDGYSVPLEGLKVCVEEGHYQFFQWGFMSSRDLGYQIRVLEGRRVIFKSREDQGKIKNLFVALENKYEKAHQAPPLVMPNYGR